MKEYKSEILLDVLQKTCKRSKGFWEKLFCIALNEFYSLQSELTYTGY